MLFSRRCILIKRTALVGCIGGCSSTLDDGGPRGERRTGGARFRRQWRPGGRRDADVGAGGSSGASGGATGSGGSGGTSGGSGGGSGGNQRGSAVARVEVAAGVRQRRRRCSRRFGRSHPRRQRRRSRRRATFRSKTAGPATGGRFPHFWLRQRRRSSALHLCRQETMSDGAARSFRLLAGWLRSDARLPARDSGAWLFGAGATPFPIETASKTTPSW